VGPSEQHRSPRDDFNGLKLRVIPNPVYLETFGAFKANPVPMAFGELYSALETRTVDGEEKRLEHDPERWAPAFPKDHAQ
jgi:TRAP-type C4-dicarboxylate transport system substrate-binding protein